MSLPVALVNSTLNNFERREIMGRMFCNIVVGGRVATTLHGTAESIVECGFIAEATARKGDKYAQLVISTDKWGYMARMRKAHLCGSVYCWELICSEERTELAGKPLREVKRELLPLMSDWSWGE